MGAFSGCTGLAEFTIPDGVTTISPMSFWFCTGLKAITFPDSVEIIGENAFYQCEHLTEVTIPNGVTRIGENAFSGCENLTIYGCIGSCAETYAMENDIPFMMLGEAAQSTPAETDPSDLLYPEFSEHPDTPIIYGDRISVNVYALRGYVTDVAAFPYFEYSVYIKNSPRFNGLSPMSIRLDYDERLTLCDDNVQNC